jgi:bacterioferritin (cytochrome b1)
MTNYNAVPTPNDDNFALDGGTHDAVRQLNSLLRGEISAVETYTMAIDNDDQTDHNVPADRLSMLREIQSEHGQAAQLLRERIRTLGGQASDSSGAWGAWAQTVQGTANLFGDTTALKSLKEGEEHGLKDYQEAIDDVDSVSRQLIEGQLIPNQQRHIATLNQLMSTTANA